MEHTFNKYYPHRVWLTSVILVLIFMYVRQAFIQNDYDDIFTKMRLSLSAAIIGALFSLPTFLVYYLSFKALLKRNLRPITTKAILCAIALVGIVITFRMVAHADTDMSYDASKLYFIFALSIFIPGLLFKIYKRI